MRIIIFTVLLLFSFIPISLQTQEAPNVNLHTGTITFPNNVKEQIAKGFIARKESIEGYYYRLLQFHEIPNQATLERIKSLSIQLLDYIPRNTYVAALPEQLDLSLLETIGVRSIMEIDADWKKSVNLHQQDYPDYARHRNNVLLMIKYYKNIPQHLVKEFCLLDGIDINKSNGVNNYLEVAVQEDKLAEIVELPYIAFVDLVPPPSVPDDTPGRGFHRVSGIDTNFPGGRKYTGEGISVLTRDDGAVGPHIDFHGRIDQTFASPSFGDHGDGVSGIFAGAGNLNPRERGMAAGAFLHVIDYDASFLDETMQLFFEQDVIITNSSYSNGCNAGYTVTTETVDQQIYDNPTLLHVFSAGNSNNNECGYGAGDQWGNITGGHKQGKNVIATANLFRDGSLVGSSSRGPAHDGRIKPDIAAHGQGQVSTDPNNTYGGFGGTSAAAPGIAGISATLQNAYQTMNNGETAPSALIKAVLLNTANDLGNEGPDFRYGWGHVNAYRAAKMLEEERYKFETVEQGTTNQFTFDIPEGVVEARLMTYWTDPAATAQTNSALINNIDISLKDSDGNTYLPWILDPSPDPATLDLPATTGVDNLNNVEQVALKNPNAGTYTLEITGTELPFGQHEYIILWEFRYDEITVVYPFGGENILPNAAERLYWDAEGNNGEFTIAFSPDNGTTWQDSITVGGNIRNTVYNMPNIITKDALIRISRNGVEDVSDANFSVMRQASNVQITKVCPDNISVTWNPAQDAASYEVYLLGEKYMEVVGTSQTSSFDIPIENPFQEFWVAVSAISADGAKGLRTIAVNHQGGLLECQQENDLALLAINEPSPAASLACENPFEGTVAVQLTNLGTLDQPSFSVGYQIENETPVIEMVQAPITTGDTINYVFNQKFSISENGTFNVKVWSDLNGETSPYDDTLNIPFTVYVDDGVEPEVQEGFEDAFPPQFWTRENPDGADTWGRVSVVGKSGDFTNVMAIANFNYDAPGQEDALWSIPMNFDNVQDDLWLTFDVAYATFGSRQDGLRIEVYTDCGDNLAEVVYEKFGGDLASADANGSFAPNQAGHWRTDAINLNDYIGLRKVILRFVAINDFGNNLFIDNININSFIMTAPTGTMSTTNEAPCRTEEITLEAAVSGDFLSYDWRFGAGSVPFSSTEAGPHTVSYLLSGLKEVRLIVTNPAGSDTIIQQINVRNRPSGSYDWAETGPGEVTFTANVNGAFDYFWDFGDGNTSTDVNPIHTYTTPGNYQVNLLVTNDCGERNIDETINITLTNTIEFFDGVSMNLSPNPNQGVFKVVLENIVNRNLVLSLINMQGQLIEEIAVPSYGNYQAILFERSDLSAGLYFLKVQEGQQIKTIKMVIE